MFDVFTEEVEVLIKDGIANLYWYKADLHKGWLRSGVPAQLRDEVHRLRDVDGKPLSKRLQMDALYERLRSSDYDRRLEVSRNFVRILVEHVNFTPQDKNHRIDVARRTQLELLELIRRQEKDREYKDGIRARAAKAVRETYDSKLSELRSKFVEANDAEPQKRGYLLESLFSELMRISGIPVEEPFRIVGEQIDGAIKYDGHFYLLELKWTAAKADPKEIGHFFFKVEGKFGARGLFLSMNGFTEGAIVSLPSGKGLNMLLLDGTHLANVIFGHYKFQELLEHSIRQATLKGKIYCTHQLQD